TADARAAVGATAPKERGGGGFADRRRRAGACDGAKGTRSGAPAVGVVLGAGWEAVPRAPARDGHGARGPHTHEPEPRIARGIGRPPRALSGVVPRRVSRRTRGPRFAQAAGIGRRVPGGAGQGPRRSTNWAKAAARMVKS